MRKLRKQGRAPAAHLAVCLLAGCMALAAPAAVAQTVTYQGVLLDNTGNAVADGAYDMQFELFDAASGGTPLWQESLPGVTVTDGMFSVNLGASTPLGSVFQDNAQVWLSVAADTGSGTVVFDPRVQMGAAPYAFDAQSLGGVSAADLEESAEIDSDVSAHDASGTAHANIRAEIDSDVSAHNASGTAHTDIRNSISNQLLQHSNSPTAHPDIRTEIDSDITAHNSNASAHSATLAPLSHTHAGADITSSVPSADSVPWTGITGVPGNLADGGDADLLDGLDSTDFAGATHTHAGTDITSAVANANAVPWSGVTGVPAGFADGVDDVDGGNAALLNGLASSAFAAASHVHSAAQITSGTMDIARLPVGTASTQVAQGNHTHALGDLSNVSGAAPETGAVLQWNGSQWSSALHPSRNGVRKVYFSGQTTGNAQVDCRVSGAISASYLVTAVFNHCGYIGSYGCSRMAFVGNTQCPWNPALNIIDISNYSSGNGGTWNFYSEGQVLLIRKEAGTYAGGGYYFVTVEGSGLYGPV